MSNEEFSREFDILYNNITSNQAPSLNSYEKSVFLTEAQEDEVLALFRGDNLKPFDLTEEVSSYLSPIIKDVVITNEDINLSNDGLDLVNSLATNYELTFISTINDCDDISNVCWFIVYESALVSFANNKCNKDVFCEVIPTTYDTFLRKQRNPFKRPNNRRVLRLNIGEPDNLSNVRSLYLIHPQGSEVKSYHYTYLKRPRPIILEDLDTAYPGYDLKINDQDKASTCELGSGIHRRILYKAVELAKAVWTSTIVNSKE